MFGKLSDFKPNLVFFKQFFDSPGLGGGLGGMNKNKPKTEGKERLVAAGSGVIIDAKKGYVIHIRYEKKSYSCQS